MGPQVDDVFTLTWDAVPRATSYQVQILRFDCDFTYTADSLTTAANSIEIEFGTAGEDFIRIQFFVAGQSVADLATWPYI